jgi:hypothetical protein
VSVRLVESCGALIAANAERWGKDRAAVVARVLAGWTPEETAKGLEGVSVDAF